jgi:uncharacterized protein
VNYIKIAFFGIFTFISLNSFGGANEFTCESPRSSLETLICQDDDLSRFNTLYNSNLFVASKIDPQQSNEISQQLYLELRKCNDEKNCLLNSYRQASLSLKSIYEKKGI